jgi:hypothetical protein
MRRLVLTLLGCAALASWLVSACGSDELLQLDATGPDAGKDASSDTSTPPPDSGKDAGPPIRSVETRPRFGALDPDNYLLDGDFEYSGMDALQYPWWGVDHDWIVTGAGCRQGLRCIEIPLGGYIFGIFVWPSSGSVDVEYYAKPSGSGDCTEEVGGIIIPLDDYPGASQSNLVVSASNPTPDADGYCHVQANVSVPSDTGDVFWALLLAPRQSGTGALLVDQASIRVPGGGGSNLMTAPATSDLASVVARARADFRQRPRPPRAEPTPVRNPTGRRAAR